MDEERRRWFAAQVERLTDRLYGTALRLTRDPDDAEDLVAETVVKAWASLGELRDAQAFQAWVQRILNNTFVGACATSTPPTIRERIRGEMPWPIALPEASSC
jgi:DNA-directed RNA polymerase specialized sigma24 family protein